MPPSRPRRPALGVECLESRSLPAGTWTTLAEPAPTGIGALLLLTDGTVMAQGGTSNTWYRLTPDAAGSYANGTWSTRAPMSTSRFAFGVCVLPSGKVFVIGGEYSGPGNPLNETNSAEIYDPATDTWTPAAPFPRSEFGDGETRV